MAAFSRLQLAAALIEYDNDTDNPQAIFHSANDSAIFSHLRRRNLGPRTKTIIGLEVARKSGADYLSVPLPSDGGSGGDAQMQDSRRSRASFTSTLQNPFRTELVEEEDAEVLEEDPEVDLSSWGLDSILPAKPKERSRKRSSQAKMVTEDSHNTKRPSEERLHYSTHPPPPLHNAVVDEFGVPGGSLDPPRRHSVAWDHRGNSTDLSGSPAGALFGDNLRPMSLALPLTLDDDNRQPQSSLPPIPFPSTSAPLREEGMEMEEEEEEYDPLAAPLPSANRLSRFDPKFQEHIRRLSNTSRMSQMLDADAKSRPRRLSDVTAATLGSRILLQDGQIGESSQAPRSLTYSGQFDSQAGHRSRTISNASLGSRMLLDRDDQSEYQSEGGNDPAGYNRMSRMEALRPRVLVMPSPLQASGVTVTVQSEHLTPEGFEISNTHGRPLPAAARTSPSPSRADSFTDAPIASNSFTVNPRLSLSASQLLFRNSLMVGGQRDITYTDIDGHLERAQEEGQQILTATPEEDMEAQREPDLSRPSGKLFGRSLIDDLEARKARQRSKGRVFMGDQRPSMMDRSQGATLIDPADLMRKPSQQNQADTSELARRNSRGKPLINLDDEDSQQDGLRASRIAKSASVFGVDTLWEREMAKLKEIEAAEEQQKAAERQKEAEQEERKSRNKAARAKRKMAETELAPSKMTSDFNAIVADNPPLLPEVQIRPKTKVPPPPSDSSSDDSDRDSFHIPQKQRDTKWFAGGSDDEAEPAQTRQLVQTATGRNAGYEDEDEDDDLPLSAHLQRVALVKTQNSDEDDEDDDDGKPLATVLQGIKKTLPENNDDDDIPLAMRRRTFNGSAVAGLPQQSITIDADDDNRPLGLQRGFTANSQMLLAQQQELMMQTQFRNSFAFGSTPSLMNHGVPGFPPAFPPMMIPQPSFSLPVQDTAKFGRVDAWRRTVE